MPLPVHGCGMWPCDACKPVSVLVDPPSIGTVVRERVCPVNTAMRGSLSCTEHRTLLKRRE